MIRTVVISADVGVLGQFKSTLEAIPQVTLVRLVDRYPEDYLENLLRATKPEAIILDFTSLDAALALAARICEFIPGIQLIGVHQDRASLEMLPVLRAGARELLDLPLERNAVAAAFARMQEALNRFPPQYPSTGELYCFLPVKGGVGATTIAVNTARAIARIGGAHPLLMDFDLNAGMVRFLLRIFNGWSTKDAVDQAHDLDPTLWNEMVRNVEGLDVLHAGALDPDRQIAHQQTCCLADYAVKLYSQVIVDLSPDLEDFSREVISCSKRVFLISTAEIHSLYLAREKFQFLQHLHLGDKVSLVLNRVERNNPLSPEQAEASVGAPLVATLPNDYAETQEALTQVRAIDLKSSLGIAIGRFAAAVASGKVEAGPAKRKSGLRAFFAKPRRH